MTVSPDWQPAAYTAHAEVARGTFAAEICADGDSPSEAFELLNSLLRKMKLKAPRGKKWEHLAPTIRIGLHDRTWTLRDADVYAERNACHREQLAAYAGVQAAAVLADPEPQTSPGLAYALCEGTPELFGLPEADTAESQPEAPAPAAEPEPVPTPAQPAKPRTRRPTKRFQNVQPVYTVPTAVFAKTGGI